METTETTGGAALREIMRHYPTGVTVISALVRGAGPVGLTATSFTSVSLDPPLILACIDVDASSHDRLIGADGFAVNILSSAQVDVAARFSTQPGETRFEGVDWYEGPFGSPVLREAVAWMECGVEQVHAAGDHSILVGRVRKTSLRGGEVLTFYRGAFGSLSP